MFWLGRTRESAATLGNAHLVGREEGVWGVVMDRISLAAGPLVAPGGPCLAQKFKSCGVRKVQQLVGHRTYGTLFLFLFFFLNPKTSVIIGSQKQQISACKQPIKWKRNSFFSACIKRAQRSKCFPPLACLPPRFFLSLFPFFFSLPGNISLNLKCEGITFVIVIARAHQIASSLWNISALPFKGSSGAYIQLGLWPRNALSAPLSQSLVSQECRLAGADDGSNCWSAAKGRLTNRLTGFAKLSSDQSGEEAAF